MSGKIVRAAVVGAGSLLGKELAEVLNESTAQLWEISLLDAGNASGQLTAAGDEALVIQSIEAEAFTGMDIVFFAGDEQTTLEHWKAAAAAGAGVVDLAGALADQPDVPIFSPWVKPDHGARTPKFDLSTVAVVSAHPAAVILGAALSPLAQFGLHRIAATVLEPASQMGSAGLDEMHSQTVSLLSFQELPKAVFDTQVAFNMNAAFGNEAKVDLRGVAQTIKRDFAAIAGENLGNHTAMQLIQAPVFSGYTASVFIEFGKAVETSAVERALDGGIISVVGQDDAAPSNQSATEEGKLLVQVRTETLASAQGSAFWLWMAADNLRLAARNAVGCAGELLAFRPGSKLQ